MGVRVRVKVRARVRVRVRVRIRVRVRVRGGTWCVRPCCGAANTAHAPPPPMARATRVNCVRAWG